MSLTEDVKRVALERLAESDLKQLVFMPEDDRALWACLASLGIVNNEKLNASLRVVALNTAQQDYHAIRSGKMHPSRHLPVRPEYLAYAFLRDVFSERQKRKFSFRGLDADQYTGQFCQSEKKILDELKDFLFNPASSRRVPQSFRENYRSELGTRAS